MRVAFLGKGGSGKTTIAAAFTSFCEEKQKVLAIDADVNVHLAKTLGLNEQGPLLGDNFEQIAKHIIGNRKDVHTRHIVATTPPSLKSNFIHVTRQDSFLKKFSITKGNLLFLQVGTYEHKDVGHTCYHGKLNALELFYHYLLDNKEDIVIADATAGIDNLGTSLYFAYDLNIFVVEPTLKSITVFKEFYDMAKENNITCYVVANKVQSQEDLDFLEKHIDPNIIVAKIPYSKSVKAFEQGESEAFSLFVASITEQLALIYQVLKEQEKDWNNYYEKLVKTHRQNSLEWWDDYYHEKISEQLDPDFSYEKVLQHEN